MQLSEIKRICKTYPSGVAGLARALEINPQNLHRAIQKNNISAALLERISQELGEPVQTFFDAHVRVDAGSVSGIQIGRDNNGNVVQTTESLRKEIENLNTLLNEKERLIQVLLGNVTPGRSRDAIEPISAND